MCQRTLTLKNMETRETLRKIASLGSDTVGQQDIGGENDANGVQGAWVWYGLRHLTLDDRRCAHIKWKSVPGLTADEAFNWP